MAKCSKCGAELVPGKKFCGNCGAEIFSQDMEITNEISSKTKKDKMTISIVCGIIAIMGIIMMLLGLFSYDSIQLFNYIPIYRLIDIIIGLILTVLGTILFVTKRK